MRVLREVKTSEFPYGVEYTRLVERQVYDFKGELKPIYTVATNNNCIQGNFESNRLSEAEALFDKLTNSLFIAVVIVHGKKHYVFSRRGSVTPDIRKALAFPTEHEANLASEDAGGAADSEKVNFA